MEIRTGVGMGSLERLRNRATALLKDSLKMARVALVDVSTAELMTEDATNGEEWGPTTKQMAAISHSSHNSDDYLRIVHVLHERFALSTQTHWRQIHKSLILLEYLLCHGPEHFVMEFRPDQGRLQDFARFVYRDWKGVDRGAAVQRRAKHVLHLLTDEGYYKSERSSAQKISKGISGFGSESLPHMSTSLHTSVPRSRSTPSLLEIHHKAQEASSTLLGDDQYSSEPETPRTSGSGRSAIDGDSSALFSRKAVQVVNMDGVAQRSPPLMQKLPPPPPRAGYKYARPPQRVPRPQAHVPDLITI